MPDLTPIQQQQCKTLSVVTAKVGEYTLTGLGSERTWPACSCPAYQFAVHGKTNFGGRMVPVPCKHIEQYQESICGWHQTYSRERQTEKQRENMICPRCSGPTELVLVAV